MHLKYSYTTLTFMGSPKETQEIQLVKGADITEIQITASSRDYSFWDFPWPLQWKKSALNIWYAEKAKEEEEEGTEPEREGILAQLNELLQNNLGGRISSLTRQPKTLTGLHSSVLCAKLPHYTPALSWERQVVALATSASEMVKQKERKRPKDKATKVWPSLHMRCMCSL